ncbi:MAG TPA: SH3 domain-containing protein [Phototrophicaceae bacterium]|nr:SH3 domain-containing protein [Phototrophicaceae bacterium]
MLRTRRSLILIFLLLVALIPAFMSMIPPSTTAQGGATITGTITPTITLLPSFTSPATVTPPDNGIVATPLPASATPSFCLTPLDFKIGDLVVLTSGISIRSAPTPDSALLANFQDKRQFTIIGGAVCTDGFNFWNIEGHGLKGWVAEGRGTQYWLKLVQRAGEPAVPCLTPLKMGAGDDFDIVNNVRIREEATIYAYTRTVVPAGSSVKILSGPVCNDGYNWWQVRATVVGVVYEGWMAEGNRFGDVYIDVPPEGDGTVGHFALHLDVGDRVQVTYSDGQPKNLRNAPDTSATILYELVEGVPMVIIGGPLCADTYNWWQVRVLASNEVIGWIAEGGPAQYWIAINELPGDGR